MHMDKELNPDLIEFIRDEIIDYDIELTPDLIIEDDLGISGDDADVFILSFSKKFNVDISKFNVTKYFHSESSFFLTDKSPLTVGMLDRAIRRKTLA